MKSKKAHSTRKHGLSRLERLLEASIRHELQIKALWKALRESPGARTSWPTLPAPGSDAHNVTPAQSLHAEFLALCREYPDIARQNPPS